MTVKQNNYSVKFANLSNISLFDKLAKEYLLMKGKQILSSPIPLDYETWKEIHQEVEKLEKELKSECVKNDLN